MREIKFRGLSGKGEWVTGWLIKDRPGSTLYGHEYPYRICWHPESGGQANCPVKKGTEGQYTGLKDKNGVEIYEGDILRTGQIDSVENPREWREAVEFDRCAFVVDGEYLKDSDPYRFEVIGNIYENPELLEPKP